MKNLNAEQIKKALGCWASGKPCEGEVCDLFDASTFTCDRWTGKNALALITSQEQRIGELTVDLEAMRGAANSYKMHNKELTEKSKNFEQAYDCMHSACLELSDKCDRLTEENERLRGVRAKFFEYKHGTLVRNALVLTKNKKEFDDFCGAIKADTVKKMHSMLCEGRVSNDTVVIVANQIANDMLEWE